jgi:hypothetical protein
MGAAVRGKRWQHDVDTEFDDDGSVRRGVRVAVALVGWWWR